MNDPRNRAGTLGPILFTCPIDGDDSTPWLSSADSQGETRPIAWVVSRQCDDDGVLFMRRHVSQSFSLYKRQMTERQRPGTLVAGSSRVMQFRPRMFAPLEDEFYNAGGLLQSAADIERLESFLATLPRRPDLVIVGLDPWWLLYSHYTRSALVLSGRMWRARDGVLSVVSHLLAARGLVPGSTRYEESGQQHRLEWPGVSVGLSARTGNGFRRDGSMRYGSWLAELLATDAYRARVVPTALERIHKQIEQFSPANGLDPELVHHTVDALKRIQRLGIEVAAYRPPFSTATDAALRRNRHASEWYGAFRTAVPATLRDAGIGHVSHGSPKDADCSDKPMFDEFHPGVLLAAKAVVEMIANADRLSVFSRIDRHERAAASADPDCPLALRLDES